jgi:hypothetical protein
MPDRPDGRAGIAAPGCSISPVTAAAVSFSMNWPAWPRHLCLGFVIAQVGSETASQFMPRDGNPELPAL